MKKILLAILVIGAVVTAIVVLNSIKKSSLITPNLQESLKKHEPSETSIGYEDPAGFTFSYPDNLSIIKNDLEDDSIYADLQLYSKAVNGSLSLIISDSKFKSLDEWVNLNKGEPKEVKLGNLKALEIRTKDRLLLGALDQGIFFTIEMPLIEEEFWMKVYSKILSGFSFVSQASATSTSDVSFEGEEVVE
ncbi:MAG: Uncharacterized protein G01um10147_999 [Microgenomates group bacterium Gr01-1014_7]|nr:MAG: Uncharacterized protein G01um10147_999 [Microgenomates group bacterium Gr01-1014_7]